MDEHEGRLLDGGEGDALDRERRLVERARRRDRGAFTQLYAAHRDMVFGLAVRLTADREVAQDVTLDAFASAWAAVPRFRGDSRFGTWVCGIAVHRAREALRGRARQWERRPQMAAAPWTERARRAVDRIDLERAIAELPWGAREALLLRHVHGLSCAEAAAVMGVSVGTVKSQTSRACALLREKLSHE